MSDVKAAQTFEDLESYRAARQFRKALFEASRSLPESEKFELGTEMRRAALSLSSHIAAGHECCHPEHQLQLLLQARGSALQLIDYLNAVADEGYLAEPETHRLKEQGWSVLQLLNDYIGSLRENHHGQTPQLRKTSTRYGEQDTDLEQWIKSIT